MHCEIRDKIFFHAVLILIELPAEQRDTALITILHNQKLMVSTRKKEKVKIKTWST